MRGWLNNLIAMRAGFGTLVLVLIALGMQSCSFNEADDLPVSERNQCVFDSECVSKHCEMNRCVTHAAETPLNVTLEVTPKRMPDGSQPFPIIADPFALMSGSDATFDLHLPIAISVHIRDSSKQIDRIESLVTFRPKLDSKFAAKSTQASTVGAGSELVVLLLAGINYDVFVQPMNPKLPPYSTQFLVEDDTPFDVDYGTITWRERKFALRNPPSTMTARAISKATGQAISNTMPLGASSTTLLFGTEDVPYLLELKPMDQPQKASVTYDDCRNPIGIVPTLTIDSASLVADKQDSSVLGIDLPTLPDPIVYSGMVAPCDGHVHTDSLPVDLKRITTSYSTGTGITASYETSTAALWQADQSQYAFCTQVLPGDYVVVVTPPLTDVCDRFAEQRNLQPSMDDKELSDAVLNLRGSAQLTGHVVSSDGNPIANASVELIALGTPGVMLSENDPTVPLYNRSRQVVTNMSGDFTLRADIGSYDVIIKPPSPSNFAWSVIYNVPIGSRKEFTTNVILRAPVAVTGTLNYQAGDKAAQRTLGSADVHAYTVIDENQSTARSIEIGRGQADENGSVTLLLTPELSQRTW